MQHVHCSAHLPSSSPVALSVGAPASLEGVGSARGMFTFMYDVIVAARAGDSMIAEALASIYGQTLAPNRVVVVVDSDDAIPAPWWRATESRFRGIELLRNPGSGMAAATSAGILHATSPYLAFLDTDDLWRPEKQALQVAALGAGRHLDAVTCAALNVWTTAAEPARHQPAFPCATFTATTFRATAFQEFGLPDPTASHFGWLYRWWSNARRQGMHSMNVAYVGLERRIHGGNSWCVDNEIAHRVLLAELRGSALRHRRSGEPCVAGSAPPSRGRG